MAAVSMHKTGGSLTQSSFLLCNNDIDPGYVRQIINLTQTTSGSYLLMSSLDIARKYMYFHGKEVVKKILELSEYARTEINKLGGYYAFSTEIVDGDATYDFDRTKLSVNTLEVGLAGIEVYDLLRDEYDIQLEFGDIGNFLAVISAGDRLFEIERLIGALSEIKRIYGKEKVGMLDHEYIDPDVVFTPQKAFYHDKKSVLLEQSVGHIAGEFVMCYPPGIPIIAPGERITKEIVEYISYAKEKGASITGPMDMNIEYINIIDF